MDVGAGPAEIQSLALDPRTTPWTIYVGTATGDVRRSADGGASWSAASTGLEGRSVTTLAIDRRRRRGVLWAGTNGGIFRSSDGGGTWKKTTTIAARDIAPDPTRRGTVFATGEGVFRTMDGGRTWRRIPSIRYALSVAIDSSRRPAIVYVGTSYDSVLRSTDGGETWSPASGGLSRLAEVLDLAVDVRTRPSTLYAATSGVAVHRSTDGGASWLTSDAPAAE